LGCFVESFCNRWSSGGRQRLRSKSCGFWLSCWVPPCSCCRRALAQCSLRSTARSRLSWLHLQSPKSLSSTPGWRCRSCSGPGSSCVKVLVSVRVRREWKQTVLANSGTAADSKMNNMLNNRGTIPQQPLNQKALNEMK